jgi:hypothetical protein
MLEKHNFYFCLWELKIDKIKGLVLILEIIMNLSNDSFVFIIINRNILILVGLLKTGLCMIFKIIVESVTIVDSYMYFIKIII